MPELRAPEKRRTGMEMRPKVRYPDQTEAAIVSPLVVAPEPRRDREFKLQPRVGCTKIAAVTES
jgi:hypothetical protein